MAIIASSLIHNGSVVAASLITVTSLHSSVIDSHPHGAQDGAGIHQGSSDFQTAREKVTVNN